MNTNKKHHFFACVSRMRFIKRWGLMRNNQEENVQEHSLQVAIIAHALATIRNTFYHGQLDPNRIATLAVFHDAAEVITSDLPRPVKYFDPQVRKDHGEIEKFATEKLTHMLPKKLQKKYRSLLDKEAEDKELIEIIKNADIISSYLKCIEEVKMGNDEFKKAARNIKKKLYSIKAPEVLYFIKQFIPSFFVTIDEWN